MSEMKKVELNAAIDKEKEHYDIVMDQFKEAKENKEYERGENLKNKASLILAMIERLKLECEVRDAQIKEKKHEKESDELLESLVSGLDEDIIKATEEYQQKLEQLVDKQEKEMKE